MWSEILNIIVDTSVLIAAVINETSKSAIVEATKGYSLYSPASVHWEIGNAFSAMFKQKRITLEKAEHAIRVYKTIPLRFVDIEIEEAIKTAKKLNIYAYDAYLVLCAIKYKAPLITLDKNLKRVALQENVEILEI